MPVWLLALILGLGTAAWMYNYLAKSNGNPSPRSNMTLAGIAGFIVFLVIFTLTKMVFNL